MSAHATCIPLLLSPMAYTLANPRHARDSTVRPYGIDGGGSDDMFGDTTKAGGSIASHFEGASIGKKLALRQTSANSPSVTGSAETSGSRVPVAAIVGVSVAGAVVLLVAGLCVYFLWWRRRKPRGRASVVKDEEMVYFPDTRPLIDSIDPETHPSTIAGDRDTHPLMFPSDCPNTPPLLGSTQRGYFPSAPASERSTPVVPSASLSALSASSSLSQGGAGSDMGPLAALGEAARGRMGAGVLDAPKGGDIGCDTVHVAEGASPVHAGYDVHSAVRLHSMHASVALASSVSASAVPTTSAGSAGSRDSTRTATQPRRWDEATDGA